MDAGVRPPPARLVHQPWSARLGGVLLLLLLGGLQALAMAWPWAGAWQGQPSGALQLLSLTGFALLLHATTSPKQAFVCGWWFATGWLAVSIWWLYISMHTYGGMPAGLAALAVFLLAAGLALFYATASGVYRLVCGADAGAMSHAFAFSAVWLLAELTRGTLWTGFPWAAAGYAHVDSVLREWAPWVGVYGLSAISAWMAMLVAASWNTRHGATWARTDPSLWGGLVMAGVLSSAWLTSPLREPLPQVTATQPALTVTLLQGNVPQDLKFGEGVGMALRDYRDALLHNTSDLIVTPETAVPLLRDYLPDGYWSLLQQRYAQGQQAALIGLPLSATDDAGLPQYTNSALALVPGAAADAYRYDKHHLVPFGEFVPPMFRWFVQLMHIPLGDFARGQVVQPPLLWHGERIAPNICFEDLFGEELAQSFANPTIAPTLLLNLSNIAWFGDTVAIDQHLHISRMRTLELGRPMLRATNTGATAIISAQGVVTHRLPSGVKGALTAEVHGVDGPPTPYARWVSAWGLWPLGLWAGLVLVAVAWPAHRADHTSSRKKRRFAP
jgi:apolipoprotein N-acyltransferase